MAIEQKPKPSEAADAAGIPQPPADGAPSQKVGEPWTPTLTNEEEPDLFLKMIIYGPSGVGKTPFAAGAEDVEELRPVLFVDAESGALSIKERLTRKESPLHRFRLDSYRKLQQLLPYIRSGAENSYKTIVIDSLSDIAKVVTRQCVIDAKAAKSNHDPEVMDQQDWNRYTERMRIIIRTVKDARVNIILTALVRETKDELSGKVSYGPWVQGQQAALDSMAYMDVVGYYAPIGGGKSIPTMFFSTNAQYVARDRSHTLPEKMENPTFTEVWKYMSGGKK